MEKWTLKWTGLTPIEEISSLDDGITGVYRLSYKHDEDNYYVFYVGQSEDIKHRLLEHKSSDETNVCIKNYISTKQCFFRYATITRAHVRNAIEKQAFKYYQPTCNENEPTGRDDVAGNLS